MAYFQPAASVEFSLGQCSSAGIKSENEDAIGIRIPDANLQLTKGTVAVIADGVSAAEAGKEASETCVQNFLADYYSTPETWSVKKSSGQVLTALNRWLYSQGRHFKNEQKGYLTTFSSLIIKAQRGYLLHVGDSRVYRLRNNVLEQLTRDHTTVISSKQTYLARAMGLDSKLDVDYQEIQLQEGDIFLLSTDGLHDFVSSKEICNIIHATDNFEVACQQLIQQACNNSSNDNISCQLLRIDTLPQLQNSLLPSHLANMPFPPALKISQAIDNLKVLKVLHASNRSHLYLVEDMHSHKQFCMKTPSVNYIDDSGYIERFIMESWIGARLNNANILKVVETNRPKQYLYYLLEFVEGITLQEWIKQHPNPAIPDVFIIIEQVIKGLRAFHRKETLHQDLKPGNIMIDNNGQVKIIDFGSCYIKGVQEIQQDNNKPDILGTATYSAPETVLNGDSNEQSDIFSLGVMLFEMLTGKQPFNGKLETCRTQKAYVNSQYIDAYEFNPLVPFWLNNTIKKSLSINPARRHADVSELLHELKNPIQQHNKPNKQLLIERNPERFWQVMSLMLLFALTLSLFN